MKWIWCSFLFQEYIQYLEKNKTKQNSEVQRTEQSGHIERAPIWRIWGLSEVWKFWHITNGGGGSNGGFVPGRSINKWKSTEVWKSMIHQKKCKSFFMIDVTSMLYFGQYRRICTEKLTRPINEGHHVLNQQFTFWPQDPFTEPSKEYLVTWVTSLC